MKKRQTRIAAPIRALTLVAVAWSTPPALAEVDQNGAYSTAIKIDVPSFHGLEPQLALSYSSNGGNGAVGTGWALQASSLIERASPGMGAPRYDKSDIFLLDGTELVPCAAGSSSPSCGTAVGGSHSAKIENYEKIQYNANNNHWTIWAKDGTRKVYAPFEQGAGSPAPQGFSNTFRWRLQSVYDTHQNVVSYQYDCSLVNGAECHLDVIGYGDSVACETPPPSPPDTPEFEHDKDIPGVRIKFFWEGRPDKILYGNGLGLSSQTSRLKSIRIKNAGWTVGAHILAYTNSTSSNRSLLAQLQQFGSDVVLCENTAGCSGIGYGDAMTLPAPSSLPPLQFRVPAMAAAANDWSPTYSKSGMGILSTGYSNAAFSGLTDPDNGTCATPCRMGSFVIGLRCLAGDVNNDQRLDKVCAYRANDSGDVRSVVSVSTRTGFKQVSNTPSELGDILTDMNGDGRDDIFTGPRSCSSTEIALGYCPKRSISVRLLTGDSSFEAPGGDIGEMPWPFVDTGAPRRFDQVLELVAQHFKGLSAKFSTGGADVPQQWFTGDVNADGMADFIYVYRSQNTNLANLCTALSTGTGSFEFLPCQTSVWNWYDNNAKHSRFFPADINGDGRVDVVHIAYHPGGIERRFPVDHASIEVAISRGDGTYALAVEHQGSAWLDDSTWLPGDVNGDGKTDIIQKLRHASDGVLNADHAYVKVGFSLGGGRFRWNAKDVGFPWNQPINSTAPALFYVADMTGDGRADLVGIWSAGSTPTTPVGEQFVAMAPAELDGFGSTQFLFQSLNPTLPGQTQYGGVNIGDVNGDGKADVVTYGLINTTVPPSPLAPNNDVMKISYDAYLSPSASVDLHNIIPIEQNGDGRNDLSYTYFTNPGYRITTLLHGDDPQTYGRVDTLVSPGDIPGVTTSLDNPDTSSWIRADVGGAEAEADGKVDLVQVEHSGATLSIYTLLSAGGGSWSKKYQSFAITTQFMPNYAARSWLSSDVDGDGRSDLVHISRNGRMVQVDTLLSMGDGTWSWKPASTYFSDFYPDDVVFLDWYAGKRLLWKSTDVNGDGKDDLVYVKNELDPFSVNAKKTVVYTLISEFSKVSSKYAPVLSSNNFRFADTQHWRTVDINNDGLSDLVYISKSVGDRGIGLNYLLSLGNGTFQAAPPLGLFTPPSELEFTYDDTQNFKLADVNGDGQMDFVHVSAYFDQGFRTGVITLLNQYPGAALTSQTRVPLNYNFQDGRNWMTMDSDFDGRADLVHMSSDLTVMHLNSPSDRLSSHENGILGNTSIQYKTSAGLHTNLPAGGLLRVADYVEQADGVHGHTYKTNYSFAGAKWSHEERKFLGFASVDVDDGLSVVSQLFDQTAQCGSRPVSIVSKDSTGKILREQKSVYAPLSAGSKAPYSCALDIQYDNECEGVSPCLENKTEFVRDAYGNVAQTLLWGRPGKDDDKKIEITSTANTSAYIVGLPAQANVYDVAGTLRSSTRYVYDQPSTSDWTQPPRSKAELTKTLRWDSETGLYLMMAYEYDAQGNQTLSTDPVGAFVRTRYDCNYNRYPESICNNLFCSTATWNLSRGFTTSVVDPNGQPTAYEHDALSRTSKITNPDGSVVVSRFLDYGTPLQRDRTEVSDASLGKWPGVQWAESYFDGLGRTYKSAREGAAPTDAAVLFRQYTFLDASERILQESSQFKSAETPVWTTHVYDGLKRRIDTLFPGGAHARTAYLPGSEQRSDALGHMRELFHDAAGRIVQVRERHQSYVNNGEGGSGPYEYYDTFYEYDTAGRMTKITDSLGRTSTHVYNSLGWELQSLDWDLGRSSFTHYANGSLKRKTDARNFTSAYTYDSIGRLTLVQHKDNAGLLTGTITQSYDRDPVTNQNQGASIGRLTQVTDTAGTKTIRDASWYDNMGRTYRQQRCIDAACSTMSSTFDIAGRLNTLTYPDGETLTSTYDGAGQLSALSNYLVSAFYNSQGQPTEEAYANSTITLRTYDSNRFRPESLSVRLVAGPAYKATYSYDGAGRMFTRKQTAPAEDMTYGYDDLNRLMSVSSISTPGLNQTFDYDQVGNIHFNSKVGFYAYSPEHIHGVASITDPVLGGTYTYGYDATGNMRNSSNTNQLTWDNDNRITQNYNTILAQTTNYSYDVLGQRASKTIGGNVTNYFSRYLETDARGTTKYYYAGDKLVAKRDPGGVVDYYHQDHLGSTRVVTDSGGAVLKTNSYEPYGTATPGQRFGFAGAESDDETGLLYMRARYQSPTLGRMLSADTVIPDLFEPQSLNRYSYVLNNPLIYSDPTGHAPQGSDPSEWSPWPYDKPTAAHPLRMDPLEIRSKYATPETWSAPPLVSFDTPEERSLKNEQAAMDKRFAELLRRGPGLSALTEQWKDMEEKVAELRGDTAKMAELKKAALKTAENSAHITYGAYEVVYNHHWWSKAIEGLFAVGGIKHQLDLYKDLGIGYIPPVLVPPPPCTYCEPK